jgi:hypothetical protein
MFLGLENDKRFLIDQSQTNRIVIVYRDDSNKCLFVTFDTSKSEKNSIEILNKAIAEKIEIDSVIYQLNSYLLLFPGQEAETYARMDAIRICLPIDGNMESILLFPTTDPVTN